MRDELSNHRSIADDLVDLPRLHFHANVRDRRAVSIFDNDRPIWILNEIFAKTK